ncbi:MAG: serine/threonine protein kinase [Planctomycetes bacterium]|nr:serine/threonine protein kinase [Planctomycetota bacterium]
MPTPLDPARDPPRLGPYTLLERAGAGGMGVVYRARHDATGALHAVKALLPGADAEDLLRFRREAEAMAAVEGHPHVLRVHSVGVDGRRPFLAMAWAPGGSLADRLQAGPLPVDEVVALGRALASGLAHLHARGVLHRDLKPENVLHDEQGAPRLADFGLARLQQAEALTATGDVLGTPAYMAPEQAEGRRDLDARTDVYGLGAVLYRALTGRPPHAGATSMAALLAALAAAPPPPRALRPDVPPWLEAVVLKALAPAPDQRWPSAEALGAALATGPAGAARRLPLAALALAALALAAVAGVAAPRAPRKAGPAAVTPAPPDLEATLARGDHAAAADLVRAALASDAPEGARAAVLALVDAGDAEGRAPARARPRRAAPRPGGAAARRRGRAGPRRPAVGARARRRRPRGAPRRGDALGARARPAADARAARGRRPAPRPRGRTPLRRGRSAPARPRPAPRGAGRDRRRQPTGALARGLEDA